MKYLLLILTIFAPACTTLAVHDGYRWAIAGAGVAAGALRDAARAEAEAAVTGARDRADAEARLAPVRSHWIEVAASARGAARPVQSLGALDEQFTGLLERRWPRPREEAAHE
ncbi:MAG: hypothetical protein Q8Q09_02735 [Deltaproteobacteria bacterium]|nr:hypothetical protein [Deltaproteobacteria bacterium]